MKKNGKGEERTSGKICPKLWTSYYRLYGYVRVRELEMDGTAISLGKGRRMQIAYVEL